MLAAQGPALLRQASRQQPKHGGFGDVSMEGVSSSVGENSIVGAMMREAQSTLAELDQFEDRRDMLERRKKYEDQRTGFAKALKSSNKVISHAIRTAVRRQLLMGDHRQPQWRVHLEVQNVLKVMVCGGPRKMDLWEILIIGVFV